jgi:hypothetical protein
MAMVMVAVMEGRNPMNNSFLYVGAIRFHSSSWTGLLSWSLSDAWSESWRWSR